MTPDTDAFRALARYLDRNRDPDLTTQPMRALPPVPKRGDQRAEERRDPPPSR